MKQVIYTIFAGRKRYLEIQKKYIDILLEKKIISEVHLWNYTHTMEDETYIINICNNNTNYKIMYPQNRQPWYWKDYYKYYSENIDENTILIKSDDDIVYIDIDNFDNFIKNIKDDVIYFPNIVNNDVCAYYQVKQNIHNLLDEQEIIDCNNNMLKWGNGRPMTTWYLNFEKANKIHNLFLSNPNMFHCKNIPFIDYGNRISINFFAINSNSVKKYFSEFLNAETNDDEMFMSVIPNTFNKLNKINLNFTVVHFQFGPQNGMLLDENHLKKYNLLADVIATNYMD